MPNSHQVQVIVGTSKNDVLSGGSGTAAITDFKVSKGDTKDNTIP